MGGVVYSISVIFSLFVRHLTVNAKEEATRITTVITANTFFLFIVNPVNAFCIIRI